MKKAIKPIIIPLLNSILLVSCVSPAIKSQRVPLETATANGSETSTAKAEPVAKAEPIGKATPIAKAIKGTAYSLPMVQVHLTAILTNVPNPDLAPTNISVTTMSNSYTETTFVNRTNNSLPFIVTNSIFQVFTNSLLAPKVDTNGSTLAYLVTVDPIISQDPNFLYLLKMTKSKVSSDTFSITVDPTNNFLQSVNATNADQSLQIVDSLARTAATVYTMGAGAPLGGIPVPKSADASRFPKLRELRPGRVEILFDPTSKDDVDRANGQLTKVFVDRGDGGVSDSQAEGYCPIRLRANFRNQPVTQITSNYLAAYRPEKAGGVLYRPMLPYLLEVYNTLGEKGTNSIQYLIRSPNAAPVFSLPVNRATFVTRTTSISFNNGFLQGVNYNNPSQVAAVLGLPLAVVGDVFSSVTNVLQLRFNIATAQSGIATQQAALLTQAAAINNATTNLLESIKRLEAYKAGSTNHP